MIFKDAQQGENKRQHIENLYTKQREGEKERVYSWKLDALGSFEDEEEIVFTQRCWWCIYVLGKPSLTVLCITETIFLFLKIKIASWR